MTFAWPTRVGRPLRFSARWRSLTPAIFLFVTMTLMTLADRAEAQSFRFDSIRVEGNQRIEPGTIASFAGIARGQAVSAAELNDAYQRVVGSGLFETVEFTPRGQTLVIEVVEFPTINRISFEGNRRLNNDALGGIVQSQPRRVFSANMAERDAARIAEAYEQSGRLAARVTPRIIRLSDNRVDLVFEIFEGGQVEIERIGFVGNRDFTDRRLRRVLETKQAGLLRALIQRDTFVEDRIEFDKQVLRDFYLSRGYVDFRTLSVNAELTRERDGYFLTFNIFEGQQFRFGDITTSTDLRDVDPDEFLAALNLRPGTVYSPTAIETSIARLERLAVRQGLNFVRVEPRITRNDRDLTLDVDFALVRGPRVFVERIDIEGNATTLDRVVRRQFRVVEGDPFNPREIRESAERIRALGYFSDARVNAREGSSPEQVVVSVDVDEAPTGSLSLGGAFSTNSGFSLLATFSERNFLGRGQRLDLSVSGATDNRVYQLGFTEPALLGRDLQLDFDIGYTETDNQFANYDTVIGRLRPGLTFPVRENARLNVYYLAQYTDLKADYVGLADGFDTSATIISREAALGAQWTSAVGYVYTFDNRRTGLNPNAGYQFQLGQEFGGLGGDNRYLKTTGRAIAQTRILNEEVTLRASVEGGMLNYSQGSSRVTDRFRIGNSIMRGFAPDGIGPRDFDDADPNNKINDALGGNMYAVAKLEAEFPLGLPEEYGISGGLFYDVGAVWGLDDTFGRAVLYEEQSWRHVAGASIFWTTPLGPLRFNFSRALRKEKRDIEQRFDVTVSTRF